MKHPNQASLALHAGGDLGWWARWWVTRHLEKCDVCREEVAAFEDVREALPELAEIPEISWSRMAAEVKANVRLGLAAGECVRVPEPAMRESAWFAGGRWLVAFASIVVLVVTGVVLERPAPRPAAPDAGPMVEATGYGIQMQSGGQTFGLTNGGAQKVTYLMDAQGSMGARYVDPDTGYLTINTVYAQVQ
jgi:hypothetical protein